MEDNIVIFAENLRNNLYKTNEDALLGFQKSCYEYNLKKPNVNIEKYLGLTYSEYSLVSYSTDQILTLFQEGKILATLTVEQLDTLYQEYFEIPFENRYERFGQFVYNKTNVEIDNSYQIQDPKKAYDLLLVACIFDED